MSSLINSKFPERLGCKYLSKRKIPLLFIDQPLNVPVITLENYTKWYDIYLVKPDGSVEAISTAVIDLVQHEHRDAMWVDHLYHPRLLYRLAAHLGACVDERAIEMAAGRWMIELVNRSELELNFHDPNINE